MRVAVHDRDCVDGEYKLKIELDIDSGHRVFTNFESGSIYILWLQNRSSILKIFRFI